MRQELVEDIEGEEFLGSSTPASNSIGEAMRYQLTPDATIQPFDTSFAVQRYQIHLNGRRYQVSEKTGFLLSYLRLPRTREQLERIALPSRADSQTANMLTDFLNSSVEMGLVVPVDRNGTADNTKVRTNKASRRGAAILLRIPIASQDALRPLTERLRRLFEGWALIMCCAFSIATYGTAACYFHIFAHSSSAFANLSADQWIVLFLINLCGLFIHELGHASACSQYGCRHGAIGLGLYYIYPAFFADVTEAWSLSRKQRAVIDVGGIYFQILFGAISFIAWVFTGSLIALLTTYAVGGMALFNLNPFLRFDGYWLLTDLTGVASVHDEAKALGRYLWQRFLRGEIIKSGSRPALLGAPVLVQATIVIYAALLSWFFIFFLRSLALTFTPSAVRLLQSGLPMLVLLAREHRFGPEFWRLIVELTLLALSCWGMAFAAFKYGARLLLAACGYARRMV